MSSFIVGNRVTISQIVGIDKRQLTGPSREQIYNIHGSKVFTRGDVWHSPYSMKLIDGLEGTENGDKVIDVSPTNTQILSIRV